jgi:hypothetical protein
MQTDSKAIIQRDILYWDFSPFLASLAKTTKKTPYAPELILPFPEKYLSCKKGTSFNPETNSEEGLSAQITGK